MHVASFAPRPLLQAVPHPCSAKSRRPLLSSSERSKNSKISQRYKKKKKAFGVGEEKKRKREGRNAVVVVVSFAFGGFVRFQLLGTIGEDKQRFVRAHRAALRDGTAALCGRVGLSAAPRPSIGTALSRAGNPFCLQMAEPSAEQTQALTAAPF